MTTTSPLEIAKDVLNLNPNAMFEECVLAREVIRLTAALEAAEKENAELKRLAEPFAESVTAEADGWCICTAGPTNDDWIALHEILGRAKANGTPIRTAVAAEGDAT